MMGLENKCGGAECSGGGCGSYQGQIQSSQNYAQGSSNHYNPDEDEENKGGVRY